MENDSNDDTSLDTLLNTNFIDLKSLEINDPNQLNLDYVLNESLRIVNNAIKNNIIKEKKPQKISPDNEEIERRRQASSKALKINTSTESNIVEENEIEQEYLNDPFKFVNYIEIQLPNQKKNRKKNTFILKKYETENNPKFNVSALNPQEELSSLMLEGGENISTAMAYEDNIITGDIFGNIKFYSLKDKKQTRATLKKENERVNAIDIIARIKMIHFFTFNLNKI